MSSFDFSPIKKKPVVAKPLVKKPIVAKPIVKKPIVAKPIVKKTWINKPISKTLPKTKLAKLQEVGIDLNDIKKKNIKDDDENLKEF